jgi:hypothetical protein
MTTSTLRSLRGPNVIGLTGIATHRRSFQMAVGAGQEVHAMFD